MESDFLHDFLTASKARHALSRFFRKGLLAVFLLTGFCQLGNNCRADSVAAAALAQSAGNYVINGFLQEIVNYSTGTNHIYTPIAPANLLPIKMVSDSANTADFYSLVRQSFPGADLNVSNDSTATAAQDGESISPARWNLPVLLSGSGFSNKAQLANWIYVSGTGVPCPVSQNVTGRFAYNVYNISGLLNANVAGYPSAAARQMANMKGTVAGTDLTQLGVSQAVVDALVAFRNPQASGTNYVDYVGAAAATGFLTTTVTGTSGTYTSNYFTSRQGLLSYASQNPGIQPALPYLTTFSLATNAPTWKPDAVASANSATIGSPTPINVDVISSSIRVATTGTFTHYDDNGNLANYSVNAGDPLIQRRFSLAKLSWITHVGPGVGPNGSTISTAAIQACFGLAWNPTPTPMGFGPSSPRWEYTALSSNARIKRLDEVAAENREPNFFELLKAGILWGSLGRDPGHYWGAGDVLNGVSARTGVEGFGFQAWSAYNDMQILQIGVNLIDQVTTGNYPNAIWSGIIPTGGVKDSYVLAELQILQTVYGTKDLPALYGFTQYYAFQDSQKHMAAWLQPSIWNPCAPSGAPSPTNFRMNTYGIGHFFWNYNNDTLRLTKANGSYQVGTLLYGPHVQTLGSLTWDPFYESPTNNPYLGAAANFKGDAPGQIYFTASTSISARIQPVPIDSGNFDYARTPNSNTKIISAAYNPSFFKDGGTNPPVGITFPGGHIGTVTGSL